MIISLILVIICLGSISTQKINQNSKTNEELKISHSTTFNKSDNLSNHLDTKSLKIETRQLKNKRIKKDVNELSAVPNSFIGLCDKFNALPRSSRKKVTKKVIRLVRKEKINRAKTQQNKQKHKHRRINIHLSQRDKFRHVKINNKANKKWKRLPRDLCMIMWMRVKKLSPSSQRRITIILHGLVEAEEILTETDDKIRDHQKEGDNESNKGFLSNDGYEEDTERSFPQSEYSEEQYYKKDVNLYLATTEMPQNVDYGENTQRSSTLSEYLGKQDLEETIKVYLSTTERPQNKHNEEKSGGSLTQSEQSTVKKDNKEEPKFHLSKTERPLDQQNKKHIEESTVKNDQPQTDYYYNDYVNEAGTLAKEKKIILRLKNKKPKNKHQKSTRKLRKRPRNKNNKTRFKENCEQRHKGFQPKHIQVHKKIRTSENLKKK